MLLFIPHTAPQTSSHKVTACQHQLHHTNSCPCRSLFCTVFQGTKGYVGPKGDEGEAGDPGNDVSNLYKAESSFSVNTVQELCAESVTLPCLCIRAHQTL